MNGVQNTVPVRLYFRMPCKNEWMLVRLQEDMWVPTYSFRVILEEKRCCLCWLGYLEQVKKLAAYSLG